MGIDFHAVAVEKALFDKYSGTSKLESLFWLADAVAEVDAAALDDAARQAVFEQIKSDYLETHGGGEDAELRLSDYQELIQDAELPSDNLEMGDEWRVFVASFKDIPNAPAILDKCFGGEHIVGDSLDAIWGSELEELAAALSKVHVEDPEYGFLLFEMKDFYQRAALSGWVVIRGLF